MNNPTTVFIDGHNLNFEVLDQVSYASPGEYLVSLTDDSLVKMNQARQFVFDIVAAGRPVYGINTGFGALANKHIQQNDLEKLQLNLIRSHCTGVGRPLSKEIVRAMMLIRINCLAAGHSGVNPEIVSLILDFLNHHITPVIPEKGSVGASGDLAPLSHLALALIGESTVEYQGKIVSSKFAISSINKTPAQLGPKDGLALINGTALMTALGALAVIKADNLMKTADIIGCLTLDALQGSKRPYDHKISAVKPHPGQVDCCNNLNKLLENSEIIISHLNCGKIQDPYSLRCIPQIHGACRQTLNHSAQVIEIELNSITDNPLLFIDCQEVISGGNFHGEALALCMDYLAMGLAEICSVSERRVEKMMNPAFSDLPAFLTKNSGLNSGLMIAHVTTAALCSENKYLCHPASVDSIPTSTDKEDHVSMGVTAGRKLHEVIFNTEKCLAIELLCNTQALEFHRPLKSSPSLEAVYGLIRKHVPPVIEDRVLSNDIDRISRLISNKEIVKSVRPIVGELN